MITQDKAEEFVGDWIGSWNDHDLDRILGPDLTFHVHKILCGVQSIVLYYESVNNLMAAEVMELSPTGQVVRVTAHYAPK